MPSTSRNFSTSEIFDVIIIGAGSAGSVLASRLTEDPNCKVLLLEAGPDYIDIESIPSEILYGIDRRFRPYQNHDWGHMLFQPNTQSLFPLPRGKIIGGSSAVNNMIFLRGEPDDYDSWAKIGNHEWSFDKVLSYFIKSENDLDFENEYHGRDGRMPVSRCPRKDWLPEQVAFYESCQAFGFAECTDHNAPNSYGVGPLPLNCVGGIRQSTLITYLHPIRHRPNLTIKSNVLVLSIQFSGKRAIGALYSQNGVLGNISCHEVCVCAGAINSPQLLMCSGIGSAKHLTCFGIPIILDLPGVGQNLCDHPSVNLQWQLVDNFPINHEQPFHQVALRYTADNSDFSNDMIIYVGANSHEKSMRMRPTLNISTSVGEIKLISADPSIRPDCRINLLSEESDLIRLRDGVNLCVELFNHSAFGKLIKNNVEPDYIHRVKSNTLDDWIIREVLTSHHLSCTCKMGTSTDISAVVDQYGKVHGIDHLRVIYASIMPSIVRANIHATVLMMAEKLVEFI